jgi:pSer/pThr/pTyr-binding forkhead associated (FHA) protein
MQVLLRVVKGELLGRAWLLAPGEYVVGRAPECQIRLMENAVSRRHCRFRMTEESVFVSDLGSRNRTRLNGYWVTEERCLRNGDFISVCGSAFRFQTYLNDIWNVSEQGDPYCDEPDDSSDDPIAHEDLLAAAGLTWTTYLNLIEQARLAAKQ